MLHDTDIHAHETADEWAVRSENWIAEIAKLQKPRRLRERNPNALILAGHGNSLRVEKGALVVKQGFTHYPQKQECHRYFKGDLDLPRIIMLLDGSGSLSFDVLDWLAEQYVALARIKTCGDVAIVASGDGFAADQTKIDWQRETLACPKRRMAFVQKLIAGKLRNSIATIAGHLPQNADTDAAIAKAERGIAELGQPLDDLQQVRAIEGECASLYFRAWRHLRPQWKISKRYPVPDSWLTYRGRSSVHECKPENRRATDPINAMLNYGYAVMHGKLQVKAIADGYSPLLGIMHRQKRTSASYILDMLEPERPRVDAAILDFVQSRTFTGADFILRKDGACRLSPQLARVVAQLV